jgi:hypothetical protein
MADPLTEAPQTSPTSLLRGSTVTEPSMPLPRRTGGLTPTSSVCGEQQHEDRAEDASSRPTLRLVNPPHDVLSVGPRKRLVEEPRHRNPERHRQVARFVVDDYGDAVAIQARCASCFVWHGGALGRCRRCKADQQKMRRRADPEAYRAAKRERRRELLARDPDARRREQARAKRAAERAREKDLEAEKARRREASQRYRERLRRERPDEYQRVLELARINNRVARERNGEAVGAPRPRREGATNTDRCCKYVLAAPMVPLLERAIREFSAAVIADEAGVTDRLLYAWRVGERRYATWDSADALLVAMDRLWWEAFDPADAQPCETFSGVRSRDVTSWLQAAEMAMALWEPQPAVGERVRINGALWRIEAWDEETGVFWLWSRGVREAFASERLEEVL